MRGFFILYLLLLTTQTTFSQMSTLGKIDELLKEYEKPNTPGLSIGVVQNGKLIYSKGIGFSTLEYNIKNSDSTVFSIASIAKQFTSACVWTLVRDKKIALDDDVRMYLPELPEYGEVIKIRHLLNHTSGFRDYNSLMYLMGFDYDTEYYDNQTLLQLACKQKGLNNIPGEKVIYGNTPYNLLAIIIERITKQNLHEYANENLFKPLGMSHTLIRTENNSLIKNRAVGYQSSDKGYLQFPRVQKSYGAGSMGSTVLDLVKWVEVLNGKNQKFTELTQFLTTCEMLPSGEKAHYGRGVMVDDYKGWKAISHSGYGLGGQSQLITLPEKQISVIIMTNLESINPTPISYKVLDLFLDAVNEKPTAKKKIFIPKSKDFHHFIGQYKELNSDMKMEILMENDTLKAKGAQSRKAIALQGCEPNKFHRINNESVKYEFFTEKNAPCDMMISFGGTPFYFKRAVFVNPQTVNLTEFVGSYSSEELGVTYRFFMKDNILLLSYRNHENIPLITVQKDEMGNGERALYHFVRNDKNEISGMLLFAEGTVREIRFEKNQ
ncbi:hypothetical protein FLJC2902T_08540 [Flavobacterium limnosediminis JC2902]|uniref:Beta-lactamase-related domain-containing protein n=1 Tax=Flavobacterium limnosediminis JC2902 TaxID=1341181 RepID=V6SS35_9FLAO|nr:serine hydrolase domain-containing protein [Flavobacterium limnosediminis]ESU29451.1 hypothetical protein FLJC2902T_08540 [Flavobacterium limnosediminis JC2902]